ncbi:MAG: hypothetical protein RL240_2278 [Planctomycetota bacterium]|jgi:hypothetical protein
MAEYIGAVAHKVVVFREDILRDVEAKQQNTDIELESGESENGNARV